jgi:hypothetical protein
MKKSPKFDDLRPYYDSEINAAMQRIADSEYFPQFCAYVYPGRNIDDIKAQIRSYTTIDEFQFQVMAAVNDQIVSRSTTRLTYSGLEKLDRENRYLFISNHRDIMLDAMLTQYALWKEGHRTSEITFGSNLMRPQVVVDIGKSNKMFKVIRGGNMRDFYNNSLHLSEYIRFTLLEKRESIWIAQRNGRTKNGIDATDQGIVKMFYMSAPENPAQALAALNIVPVSISYQWESCDFLKTAELYKSRSGEYKKQPDEDLNSILTGILQPKGNVHIHFGNPITMNDLQPLADLPNNRFNQQTAALIDSRILPNYHLFDTNYIACDIRSGRPEFATHYSTATKEQFERHMSSGLNKMEGDRPILQEIFLGIYANPVDNVIKYQRD